MCLSSSSPRSLFCELYERVFVFVYMCAFTVGLQPKGLPLASVPIDKHGPYSLFQSQAPAQPPVVDLSSSKDEANPSRNSHRLSRPPIATVQQNNQAVSATVLLPPFLQHLLLGYSTKWTLTLHDNSRSETATMSTSSSSSSSSSSLTLIFIIRCFHSTLYDSV